MQNSTPSSISRLQRPNGSFAIRSTSIDEPPDSVVITLHALLLDLLQNQSAVNDNTTRLAQYILSTLNVQDFDTTLKTVDTRAIFHALAALYEYNPSLVLPDILAKSIAFLTTHELATGGPYVNVLSKQRVADFATNVSISRFVHAVGGPFPALISYINTALTDKADGDHYFASEWPLQLQLTRMYKIANIDMPEGLNKDTVAQADTWPCREPWKSSEALYGMPALTVAKRLPRPSVSSASPTLPAASTSDWQKPHASLVRRAMAHYSYDATTSAGIRQALSRISRVDHSYEIGLLATRFAPSLGDRRPAKLILDNLGIANLYNWAAYITYDDILDEDSGTSLLPIANTALRASVDLFYSTIPSEAFRTTVRETFDTVDAANSWELAYCRFPVSERVITVGALPNYGNLQNLYGRSLTHSLPIIGTLVAAGIPFESSTTTSVVGAFKQYLCVRQLSDDLHDWEEDVRAGHISYVVSNILHHARITRGDYELDKLVSRLEKVHFRTLPLVGRDMLRRAANAHKLLRSTKLSSNTVIDELLSEYEQSTQRMLDEHARVTSFLRAYKPQ
jgi:hypothetical protein